MSHRTPTFRSASAPNLSLTLGRSWMLRLNRGGELENSVRSIAHKVDQHLLELIRIGNEHDFWSGLHAHFDSGFQTGNSRDQLGQFDIAQHGGRHLRQPPVSFQKTMQRSRTRLNNFQPMLQVVAHISVHGCGGDTRIEASCNRFDGRQRVAQFVSQDADQASATPCVLLPAKRGLRPTEPPECGARHFDETNCGAAASVPASP